MKSHIVVSIALLGLLWSCAGSSTASYDPALCENLAVKVELRDSLTQEEYTEMIDQSRLILSYLVDRSEHLSELPADARSGAYRELLADPDYMERFGYLFTLGSALYQADATGRLDAANAEAYAALDDYNERFAEITDRM